jgi:hypothetical protein
MHASSPYTEFSIDGGGGTAPASLANYVVLVQRSGLWNSARQAAALHPALSDSGMSILF